MSTEQKSHAIIRSLVGPADENRLGEAAWKHKHDGKHRGEDLHSELSPNSESESSGLASLLVLAAKHKHDGEITLPS